jgi:hypothetical protein
VPFNSLLNSILSQASKKPNRYLDFNAKHENLKGQVTNFKAEQAHPVRRKGYRAVPDSDSHADLPCATSYDAPWDLGDVLGEICC